MSASDRLTRLTHMIPVTIANGASVSGAFYMGDFAGGIIIFPAAWTAANLAFQVSATETGTYAALHDDDTDQLVQVQNVATGAVSAYAIPAELFGATWVKLLSKSATAGTDTAVNQAADRVITVILKS